VAVHGVVHDSDLGSHDEELKAIGGYWRRWSVCSLFALLDERDKGRGGGVYVPSTPHIRFAALGLDSRPRATIRSQSCCRSLHAAFVMAHDRSPTSGLADYLSIGKLLASMLAGSVSRMSENGIRTRLISTVRFRCLTTIGKCCQAWPLGGRHQQRRETSERCVSGAAGFELVVYLTPC
jgi:hypothetical protein